MKRHFLLAYVVVSVVTVIAAGSCIELDLGSDDEDCTEIGCGDGVTVSLRHNGEWTEGKYEFRFDVDGKQSLCSANLPEDLPGSTTTATLSCAPALDVSLSLEFECHEMRTKDAVSQSCQPIADRWLIRAQIDGTPRKLKVHVARGDEELLSKSLDLKYDDVRPNGAECGPVCKQSAVDLKLE